MKWPDRGPQPPLSPNSSKEDICATLLSMGRERLSNVETFVAPTPGPSLYQNIAYNENKYRSV